MRFFYLVILTLIVLSLYLIDRGKKKRYVYMVQSGIMNYNGCAAGAKAMVKEEIFPFINTIRLVERIAKMIGEAK